MSEVNTKSMAKLSGCTTHFGHRQLLVRGKETSTIPIDLLLRTVPVYHMKLLENCNFCLPST